MHWNGYSRTDTGKILCPGRKVDKKISNPEKGLGLGPAYPDCRWERTVPHEKSKPNVYLKQV